MANFVVYKMNVVADSRHPFTIRAIFIRASRMNLVNGFDPTVHQVNLYAQIKCNPKAIEAREVNLGGDSVKTCSFTTEFDFRYVKQSESGEPPGPEEQEAHLAAEIHAEIVADYIVNHGRFPANEKLTAWGQTNALLHTWPYWRELVQSSLLRMGLPVTVAPLLDATTQMGQTEPPTKTNRSQAHEG